MITPLAHPTNVRASIQMAALINLGIDATRLTEAQVILANRAKVANAVAQTVKGFWLPPNNLTVQEMIDAAAAAGTNLVALFTDHEALVAEYWVDVAPCPGLPADPAPAPAVPSTSKKGLLLAAFRTAGILVTTNPTTGAPVFGCIKPYTPNPDGSITLQA